MTCALALTRSYALPPLRNAAMVSGIAIALSLGSAGMAQSNPSGFSLPTPTPTPTAAPQGPADERAGVPIGPRVIRPVRQTPTPTPTPTPAASPTSAASAQTAPAQTAPAQTAPAAQAPSGQPAPTRQTTSPTTARTQSPTSRPASPAPAPSQASQAASAPANAGASGAEVPLGGGVAPGFDSLPDMEEEALPPVGPDGWYDIAPGADGAATQGSAGTDSTGVQAPAASFWSSTQNLLIIAGLALLSLLAAALAFVMRRRIERERELQSEPNPNLTSGIRSAMANQMPKESGAEMASDYASDEEEDAEELAQPEPKQEPEPRADLILEDLPAAPPAPTAEAPEPEQTPDPEPKPNLDLTKESTAEPVKATFVDGLAEGSRIDLELEIVTASRSFMMFFVDFRLNIANRADKALRDLQVWGELRCAQSSNGQDVSLTDSEPLATIERIGPQQGGRVSGNLQLPLAEVKAIRQGKKPLFIPLINVTIEGKDRPATSYTFVVGTPSANSTGRVHPLPLDGPPGGLPPLRAQLIKQTPPTGIAADAAV